MLLSYQYVSLNEVDFPMGNHPTHEGSCPIGIIVLQGNWLKEICFNTWHSIFMRSPTHAPLNFNYLTLIGRVPAQLIHVSPFGDRET